MKIITYLQFGNCGWFNT